MLAPVQIRKFTSYIIGKPTILDAVYCIVLTISGWLVIAAWQALLAGCSYLGANMIIALISMNNPNYSPQNWHGTLLLWALTIFGVSLNAFANALIPKFELVVLVLHIAGFFAVLIPLLAVSQM